MKVIIFDLDGVLVDAKLIHYKALNLALGEIGEDFIIPWNEHLSIYDGLKTRNKLNLLTERRGLPLNEHQHVWERKQYITRTLMAELKYEPRLVDICKKLTEDGFVLACCSNSIRRSVLMMLSKIGVIEYMDLVLSNEDVINSKPHPEMYWKAMSMLKCVPKEALIIEDSPPGLLAAALSGAHVLRVVNPEGVTYEKIIEKIHSGKVSDIPAWQGGTMNIVIPAAGRGAAFHRAGYTFPKALIDVNGAPMIQRVVDNININAHYIFLVKKEDREKYNIDMMFKLLVNSFTVVEVDVETEGAACTVLLAKSLINTDDPLIIANADQLVEWNSNEFMYKMQERKPEGAIVTFKSTHPMWSFVKTDKDGIVIEVAEKRPISDTATVGMYYWNRGSDFVRYAEQMIHHNKRVNGEFFVCPVYNEAIEDGKKIETYAVENMWSLGTPEDLHSYLLTRK